MSLTEHMRQAGVTPRLMKTTQKIKCPRCGLEFSLFQSRAIACVGCSKAALNCEKARCLRCDLEFPLYGPIVPTEPAQAMLGTSALQVKRITLDANSISELFGAVNAERFVYVVRGKGQADVADETFPLNAESVLWHEKDDTFQFEGGVDCLELLLCRAPAGE